MGGKIALLAAGVVLVALVGLTPALGATSAPAAGCRHQGDVAAPPALQVGAMRCLVNRARRSRGLPGLAGAVGLDRAAERKSADILRCDEFSHEACGRDFTYWIERSGHLGEGCAGVAENIAWGTGHLATPRAIFRAWMRSPGHRRNILGRYAVLGIGIRVGTLGDRPEAHVWTQAFAGDGC